VGFVLSAAATAWARAPAFNALPEGVIGPVPATAPEHVAAGKHAPSFVLALPPQGELRYQPAGSPGYVRLLANASADNPSDPIASSACFAVMQNGELPGSWPLMLETTTSVARKSPLTGQKSDVLPAQFERLSVDRAGRATLEVSSAWLDTKTLGTQLLSHTVIALRRIASGPGGVQVYALRDGHKVDFIVSTLGKPEAPLESSMLRSLLGSSRANRRAMTRMLTRSLSALTADGRPASSDCGFLRVPLAATPEGGASADVQARVALPPRPGDQLADSEIRLRPLGVHLGVSQMSSDLEPVVSVSFGWAGPEQDQSL
jgi:hypothetical protein